MPSRPILRVALNVPARQLFSYLPPAGPEDDRLAPGCRLRVPFRRATRVGVLVERANDSDIPSAKLRTALAVLDDEPVISSDHLDLLRWAADYYHHPIGEVIWTALPGALRQGRAAQARGHPCWCITKDAQAHAQEMTKLANRAAPKQVALLHALRAAPLGLSANELNERFDNWRRPMQALLAKQWVQLVDRPGRAPAPVPKAATLTLNPDQKRAVEAVNACLDRFQPFLLDGVTGSGKTEVYLRIVEQVLATGKQALILVPEIGLTRQTIDRFRSRLPTRVAVIHSGMSESERLAAWLNARDGLAGVIIGTRSAIWTAAKQLGVIIVDEEHDVSYKQQEGFRYSARDVAVMRARLANVPVLLGTATPSLESLLNTRGNRYRHMRLSQRAGAAENPAIHVLDVRNQPMAGGLCPALLAQIQKRLAQREQSLLFLNRRGYAPVVLCHRCGWTAACSRCDAKLAYHRHDQRLRCHHCGTERRMEAQCPACGGAQLVRIGQGTQRVVETLAERFPKARIVRIDRDTTRRKGAREALLAQAKSGDADILVGTQMLSKGHHFPKVTLVGVIDADNGLYGADFRSTEHLAQLLLQVAGRAGRESDPGMVVIQTHHPDHPLLLSLIHDGYHAFANAAIAERRAAQLPPYTAIALVRAEAPDREDPARFLTQAKDLALANGAHGVILFGPIPAPMERRAGRYRAHLLLQSKRRHRLRQLFETWLPQVEDLRSARKVRWSLDVDPYEIL